MAFLQIVARQDREALAQFLVRLCAGVGGLVATSQIICGLLKSAVDFYCCRREGGRLAKAESSSPPFPPSQTSTADLLVPGERIKRPSYAGQQRQQQASQHGAVTLQEAEKLIKM